MKGLGNELHELSTMRLNGPFLFLVGLSMVPMMSVYLINSATAVAHGAPVDAMVDQVAVAPGASSYISVLLVGIMALFAATSGEAGAKGQLGLPRPGFLARISVAILAGVAATLIAILALALAAVFLLPPNLLAGTVTEPNLWIGLFGVFTSHLTWATVGSLAGFLIRRTAPGIGLLIVLMQGPSALSFGSESAGLPAVSDALNQLPPGLIRSATFADPASISGPAALAACWALLAWCVGLFALGWLCFRRGR